MTSKNKYALFDFENNIILEFKEYDLVEYFGRDEIYFYKGNQKITYHTQGKLIKKEKVAF